jgi:hypothetical protein
MGACRVPQDGAKAARYYGWHSNRARGERKKVGLEQPGDKPDEEQEAGALGVADHQPGRVPSKKWRQLIRKAPSFFHARDEIALDLALCPVLEAFPRGC